MKLNKNILKFFDTGFDKGIKNNRDKFIDTAKGLCILFIIFIHSVFWSGVRYTPLYIKNIALLFDVPLFFFLTGCLLSIKPNTDPIKQIAKIIIIFFIPVFIINLISGYCSLTNILQPVFLESAKIKMFTVVGGSYWFIPVYAIGLIYSVIIVRYLNKFWQIFILISVPIYYIYSWILQRILYVQVLGIPLQRELFYIWIILLGFMTYKYKEKLIWVIFILIGGLSYMFFNLNIDLFSLQNYKFVTHLPYILTSLFSIGLVMILKPVIKNDFLAYIGSRSIYFYLSQGIGASMLFIVVKYLHINWLTLLIICFCINLIVSLVIGFLFCKISDILKDLNCRYHILNSDNM